MKYRDVNGKYRAVFLWIAVLFVLHGVVRFGVGVIIDHADIIPEHFSYEVQRGILSTRLLLLALADHLVPVLVSIYILALGVAILLERRLPPRKIPMPFVEIELCKWGAVKAGIVMIFIAMLFLVSGWLKFYQVIEVSA